MDTAGYLFANMQRFVGDDFVPTFEDFTRLRVRTLGVKTEQFEFNNFHFQVTDVGGQRNERRKWFSQFDKCKAVIYVCSLAGYSQV